mmetsp:Transcript_12890/g.14687  ORF Transcript_12890/g.14687 Transcript_12890/m.14687 type:complete len:94 (+) Transcript_12890:63-344(+)
MARNCYSLGQSQSHWDYKTAWEYDDKNDPSNSQARSYDIDGGVKLIQRSDDDCAIQLIHYHTQLVSSFCTQRGIRFSSDFLCKHEIRPCAMLQ